jgi:hypothetical protein
MFFAVLAIALAIVVFAGFSRTFFLRPWFPEYREFAAPESIFYLHGAVYAAWFLLLVVQSCLVSVGRLATHQRLGMFGAGLASIMFVIGVAGCLVAAKRPGGFIGVPVPPLQFLALPIVDLLLFALFVFLGIRHRRKPQAHKRLMILATVNLVEAAIIRLPFAFIIEGAPLMSRWLTDIFILLIVVWDLVVLRRVHPVTLWGGLLIIASQPLRLLLAESTWWQRIADWAVSVV